MLEAEPMQMWDCCISNNQSHSPCFLPHPTFIPDPDSPLITHYYSTCKTTYLQIFSNSNMHYCAVNYVASGTWAGSIWRTSSRVNFVVVHGWGSGKGFKLDYVHTNITTFPIDSFVNESHTWTLVWSRWLDCQLLPSMVASQCKTTRRSFPVISFSKFIILYIL